MPSPTEQAIINNLKSNWIWVPEWVDSSTQNTAGRLVKFFRSFTLTSPPSQALLHFTADTRYKLLVNGTRVAVGPARSSPLIWYYDTLDIAPYLTTGENEICFVVIRYFASSRGGMPFERTSLPGLTVFGSVSSDANEISLDSKEGWQAVVDESILFPMGLIDDVFLHISERITPSERAAPVTPKAYNMKTLNGELLPWRLRPREIPMPEQTPVGVTTIRSCDSDTASDSWASFLSENKALDLAAGTHHTLQLQADVHSTAFLRWSFQANKASQIRFKITYSEGYELEPRSYPFFRTKADRLDSKDAYLIGPYDDVAIDVPASQTITYEPFWFRTFRVLQLEVTVGPEPIKLLSFKADQVNYPLAVKAFWSQPGDTHSGQMWDVSIRTMRNCMFDGYSDCPFYEQLQFPSHVPQIIAGFSLYWVLQVCDHHLFFGDTPYSRSFLPRIDGVFEFFDSHIDDLGLVSGLPEDVWQYVDWVTAWGATDENPDKGVPTSGRKSNRHTYFSMLYAYVLKQAAKLVRNVGRPGHADEYESRAASVTKATQTHCFDGRFFTDSTADIAGQDVYSQHCQVFAILCGAAQPEDHSRLLTEAFSDPRFFKCSYVMQFYALRAFAIAGDNTYETYWGRVWEPWKKMLANNMSTWEEDDVRQRSDCHAWGSVPVYEFCTEVAGIQPRLPGSKGILFKPRLGLSDSLDAKVALGNDNVATVSWKRGEGDAVVVKLTLDRAIDVVSKLPGVEAREHGCVDLVELAWDESLGVGAFKEAASS
ncbi:hypothetical protein CEP54_014742 [Fusarium duplospermum]|uniref:Alpha-L-rhamnosidase six-hairpin glycosidase domain-containing protein n=1 Tax=Fusarium duplospermum TaxID=1325734 RepID=A0A428NU42_9HYPO|nr:hypothetical protein CEP54_014742 [Fusarium duplospermum]